MLVKIDDDYVSFSYLLGHGLGIIKFQLFI